LNIGYSFAYEEAVMQSNNDNGPLLDTERAARDLLQMYRKGLFGRLTLDDCSSSGIDAFFSKSKLAPVRQ
jgi:hypothetical protein